MIAALLLLLLAGLGSCQLNRYSGLFYKKDKLAKSMETVVFDPVSRSVIKKVNNYKLVHLFRKNNTQEQTVNTIQLLKRAELYLDHTEEANYTAIFFKTLPNRYTIHDLFGKRVIKYKEQVESALKLMNSILWSDYSNRCISHKEQTYRNFVFEYDYRRGQFVRAQLVNYANGISLEKPFMFGLRTVCSKTIKDLDDFVQMIRDFQSEFKFYSSLFLPLPPPIRKTRMPTIKESF